MPVTATSPLTRHCRGKDSRVVSAVLSYFSRFARWNGTWFDMLYGAPVIELAPPPRRITTAGLSTPTKHRAIGVSISSR